MHKMNFTVFGSAFLSHTKRSAGKKRGTDGLTFFLCLLSMIFFSGCKKAEDHIYTLKTGNYEERQTAARALEKIGIEKLKPVQQAIYYVYTGKSEEAARVGRPAVEPLLAAYNEGSSMAAKGEWPYPTGTRTRLSDDTVGVFVPVTDLDEASFGSQLQGSAAEALGMIDDPNAVEPLLAALRGWTGVRKAATKALGKIGIENLQPAQQAIYYVYTGKPEEAARVGQPAVEPLLAALSSFADVRKAAVEALGKIGIENLQPVQQAIYYVYTGKPDEASRIGQPAVEPLIDALRKRDSDVRESAAEALRKMGQPAPEFLITALKEGRPDAAEALGRIGDPNAVEPLITALREGDLFMRNSAAEALGRIGEARAVEILAAALKDGNPTIRESAAEALKKIGDPKAADALYARDVETLVAALKVRDFDGRRSAAKALGRIRGARAIAPLVDCLTDTAWGVRCAACEALADIGQPAVEPLLERLATHPAGTTWTRIALILCGHQESASIVLQGLKQGSYSAEIRCLFLGWFGPPQFMPQLDRQPFGKQLRAYARVQRLNNKEWGLVVAQTMADHSRIEFTLSAISLCPQNYRRQSQVEDLSRLYTLLYIGRGDISMIPILTSLLDSYGSERLAKEWLNSGQSDLKTAAQAWLSARGYIIINIPHIEVHYEQVPPK